MSLVIKVCGLRRPEDAELALDLGADYLGVVMASDSPRCATVDEAKAIADLATGRASVVLVFRDSPVADIVRLTIQTSARRIQVHGEGRDTGARTCAVLKAAGFDVHPVYRVETTASYLPPMYPASPRRPAVLDVGNGGTGRSFPWDLLGERGPRATLVAGGVTPDNVARLLRHHPFGIDVSSGVESEPGVKDPEKLRRLFAEARR